jgi:sugar phosphate isomerase/epimerase
MWQNRPVTGYICDDVCADPRELNRYYDALNDPEAFTVCLDLGHVALCGREPQDAIRTIGHDRLGALHVHDVDYVHDLHTLPGSARINWDAVCRALADIDYKGEFTLESDGFLNKYDVEFRPTATRFMADVCKHLTGKIEAYKAAK